MFLGKLKQCRESRKIFVISFLQKKRIIHFLKLELVYYYGALKISRDHHNHFTLNILIIFINQRECSQKMKWITV